jgi:hypothetical protein
VRDEPAISEDIHGEGRCLCGCGDVTTVAKKTDRRHGTVKGKPRKFVRGHHRRLPDKARYEVEKGQLPTPCWVWRGYVGAHGYGHTGTDLAHRYFYRKYVGPIPKGLVLHHACSLKTCVNPDHLEPISKRENSLRASRFVRSETTNTVARRATYAEEDRGYVTLCWIWQGRVDSTGYGRLGRRLAHRVFYEYCDEPVPDGMDLDHLCGVRSCVNPQHLEAVTRAVNVRRGKLGKLTPEIVRWIRIDDVLTYAELSKNYGVTKGYVGMIKNRRRWKDVS